MVSTNGTTDHTQCPQEGVTPKRAPPLSIVRSDAAATAAAATAAHPPSEPSSMIPQQHHDSAPSSPSPSPHAVVAQQEHLSADDSTRDKLQGLRASDPFSPPQVDIPGAKVDRNQVEPLREKPSDCELERVEGRIEQRQYQGTLSGPASGSDEWPSVAAAKASFAADNGGLTSIPFFFAGLPAATLHSNTAGATEGAATVGGEKNTPPPSLHEPSTLAATPSGATLDHIGDQLSRNCVLVTSLETQVRNSNMSLVVMEEELAAVEEELVAMNEKLSLVLEQNSRMEEKLVAMEKKLSLVADQNSKMLDLLLQNQGIQSIQPGLSFSQPQVGGPTAISTPAPVYQEISDTFDPTRIFDNGVVMTLQSITAMGRNSNFSAEEMRFWHYVTAAGATAAAAPSTTGTGILRLEYDQVNE